MSDVLIKNGQVVTADSKKVADILATDGVISAIGSQIPPPPGAEIIEAGGFLVIPGGVDVHTHLDLTVGQAHVSDGWLAGSRAAAFGGVTTVVEHPGFGPEDCSLFHQLNTYRNNAAESVIDYGLHGVFQHWNRKVAAEVPRAVEEGYPSFKAYMTYDGRLNEDEFLAAIKVLGASGGLMTVHAENNAIVTYLAGELRCTSPGQVASHPASRPDYAEAVAIETAIALAEAAGDRPLYIVHLSTAKGLDIIRAARRAGKKVWAETCPQYLILTDDKYQGDFETHLKYIMSPPLRKKSDVEALWEGLFDGTISTVGTDHCSFSWADKKRLAGGNVFKCPGGVPGVETRLPLLYSEGVVKRGLDLRRWVDLVSTTPARLFGLEGKGEIAVGQDADLVVFDPDRETVIDYKSLHQQVDYTPYEGLTIKGWPRTVLLRGRKIVEGDTFVGGEERGKFIARKIFTV